MMENTSKTTSSCLVGVAGWLRGSSPFLCAVYFIAQWGDWLWIFASGIYLINMDNGILRLAGLMGFSSGACVLFFGGLIGKWVDRNPRLFVIRTCLVLVNSSLMLSAVFVFLALHLMEGRPDLWYGPLGHVVETFMVIFAVLRQLFNLAYRISLDRDWVVVVAAGDKERLANLNATTRALDMAAKILSPLCMGALMNVMSLKISTLFICFWNLVSVFLEYLLLLQVYKRTPALAVKADADLTVKDEQHVLEEEAIIKPEEDGTQHESSHLKTVEIAENEREDLKKSDFCPSLMWNICHLFTTMLTSWQIYLRQRVLFAGVGFSMLYMTVLSFDSVTTGYIYSNGVSESMAGMLMSLAGAMGFISPLIYPTVRKAIGLENTGIIAFSCEVFCLVLAVVSIWVPGSPFDVHFKSRKPDTTAVNCSVISNSSNAGNHTSWSSTSDYSALLEMNVTDTRCQEDITGPNASIVLFLVGVILSRTGLWLADLSVTQIMQENIAESERGVVNGVQNSLNMVMEMIKYTLVMVAPHIETYGILIILTFLFILIGDLFFVYYVYQTKKGRCRTKRNETDEA